jgi:hypothetical protein
MQRRIGTFGFLGATGGFGTGAIGATFTTAPQGTTMPAESTSPYAQNVTLPVVAPGGTTASLPAVTVSGSGSKGLLIAAALGIAALVFFSGKKKRR